MSFQPDFRRVLGGGRSRRGESWRSSRHGQGSSRETFGTSTTRQAPAPRPLGPVVDTIALSALLIEDEAPGIRDVKYVSSYNWLDSGSPIILVPGSPPAWTPPVQDSKLTPDSGDVFRDINAARYSPYPMEPAIRSIRAMKPEFDLQDVDIIGCGSTIGNLLRFAGGIQRPFRFDADIIGDTVVFVRRENSPTELIQDVRGYGHTFPQAYTTWDSDVRSSCSHQRIIQYDFGGVQFLVRTETDGYVRSSSAPAKPDAAEPQSLEILLTNMTVGKNQASEVAGLELRMQGTPVSQEQIFDIKTRASYKHFDKAEIHPRLWVNQTPQFLVAYHTHGLFDKPQITDVKDEILHWQNENSKLLAKFQSLVKRVVEVLRDSDNEQFEISWDGQGSLCITKQIGERRRALPSDLLQLWEA